MSMCLYKSISINASSWSHYLEYKKERKEGRKKGKKEKRTSKTYFYKISQMDCVVSLSDGRPFCIQKSFSKVFVNYGQHLQ